MGSKTSGFPSYNFNPLGFRRGSGSGGIVNVAEALIWAKPVIDATVNGYDLVKCDADGTINTEGLYFKAAAVYSEVVTADVNEYLYTAGVANVILFEDIIYGGQLFVSSTKNVIAMYSVAQTGDYFDDIVMELQLYEYAIDNEAARAVDSEGYYAINIKATTTIVE